MENLPNKDKARRECVVAVRKGILVREACEVCGDKKVEGHHTDYTQPLKVMWLCRKHHRQWHKDNGIMPGTIEEKYQPIFVPRELHAIIKKIASDNHRTMIGELHARFNK